MSIELTPFLTEHAPWSLSKVDAVAQCPRKFMYGYVRKPDKALLGVYDNYDARVGTAVHKLLQYMLQGQSIDRAVMFVLNELDLVTKEQEALEASRPAALRFLSMFNAFRKSRGKHNLLIEEKIAVSLDGNKCEFFGPKNTPNKILLRGVVDVGCVFPEHSLAVIVDHKTGKNKGIAAYANQMACYALLIKANYPNITRYIPAINWVQDSDVELGKEVDVTNIEPLMDKVVKFMLESTKDIDNSKLETAKVSILCRWCDYRALCPDHAASLTKMGGIHGEIQESQDESSIGCISGLNT